MTQDAHGDSCAVITTCPDESSARKLAESIVAARLGACVQIDTITSCYRWEGAVQCEPEWRLTIKTHADRFEALRDHIRTAHEYEVPEIVMLPIVDGSAAYLDWVRECTRPTAD
ncbi:MAG: divalent cation tolerance protein CutA [Chitinivibrionales bacterium]|nr:divalent cation tolerance protein CutA [Chitinivibrionales bacterium]